MLDDLSHVIGDYLTVMRGLFLSLFQIKAVLLGPINYGRQ